ncbi:MAG: hypothetical protein IT537_08465 [Hyphomicrobiales bacterium]|nr:hypothetical protein [Hyphomicrobiales bacterium]
MRTTDKQRRVLEAASLFEFIGPPRGNTIENGVIRSLVAPHAMLSPHKSGGYALTKEGRDEVERFTKRWSLAAANDDEIEDHDNHK